MLYGTTFILGAVLAFSGPSIASDLPHSGTIKLHSGFKANIQGAEVGEKHFIGSALSAGVTHNDAGSGPFHMGAAVCAVTFDDVNGSYDLAGRCAFGDADGDKMFITFTAKGTDNVGEQGVNTIIGGTGKFASMQGKGQYQCKNVNPSQFLFACAQQFDYSLSGPAASQ
jgi:hypothetical protein